MHHVWKGERNTAATRLAVNLIEDDEAFKGSSLKLCQVIHLVPLSFSSSALHV